MKVTFSVVSNEHSVGVNQRDPSFNIRNSNEAMASMMAEFAALQVEEAQAEGGGEGEAGAAAAGPVVQALQQPVAQAAAMEPIEPVEQQDAQSASETESKAGMTEEVEMAVADIAVDESDGEASASAVVSDEASQDAEEPSTSSHSVSQSRKRSGNDSDEEGASDGKKLCFEQKRNDNSGN